MGFRKNNKWTVRSKDNILVRKLVKRLKIAPIAAQLLINRGLTTVTKAEKFLNTPRERLEEITPSHDIRAALDVIKEIISKSGKIIIHGDYDADGVTATAVLMKVLKAAGADVVYHIPHRLEDGYDICSDFVDISEADGVDLIITVDCGIRAYEAVELAREKGIKVIITDHHEPGRELPRADAIINPKLCDDENLLHLSGVGIAFILAQCMIKDFGLSEEITKEDMLGMVALGTIADAVPLLGHNRVLVKYGLERLPETSNIGLQVLMKKNGLKEREISETDIAFLLAPCINAVGRIGDASRAVRLLLTDCLEEAEELALEMIRENGRRKRMERKIVEGALERVEDEIDLEKEKVIVLASHEWHPGVIGIAASRIAEAFNRPTLLISLESGIGKGSARSYGNFNLYQAFVDSGHLFIKYGGHEMAGGFSISEEKIPHLRRCINDYALIHLSDEDLVKEIVVDCEVLLSELDFDLIAQLEGLKPFGNGNERPRLLYRGAQVRNSRLVGRKKDHIMMELIGENLKFRGIGFRLAESCRDIEEKSMVDIIFYPEINDFTGQEAVELNIEDIKLHRQESKTVLDLPTLEMVSSEVNKELNDLWTKGELDREGRFQFIGYPEKAAKELAAITKENNTPLCLLFPLRSMAADFEKSLQGGITPLNICKIDGSSFKEEIDTFSQEVLSGDKDLIISTFECWLQLQHDNHPITKNFGLMGIHLGFWPKATHYLQQVLADSCKIMNRWGKTTVILGSGEALLDTGDELKADKVYIMHENASPYLVGSLTGNDKISYIKDLCASLKDQAVVLTNSSKEAMDLYQMLNSLDSLRLSGVGVFTGILTSSQKSLVLNAFNEGALKILVASRNLEQHFLQEVPGVVFSTFPLSIHDLGRFFIAQKIYLAYNDNDMDKTFKYLSRGCPQKDLLNHVYLRAVDLNCEDPQLLVDQIMKENPSFRIAESLFKTAAAIINELGLLGLKDGVLEAKVDPLRSWRYREAENELKAYYDLVEFLAPGRLEAAGTYMD